MLRTIAKRPLSPSPFNHRSGRVSRAALVLCSPAVRSLPLRRLLLCALLLTPLVAGADDDGGADASVEAPLDASVPDASVGSGGADRDNPEGEDGTGRVATTCRQSADCERGFTCNERGRCVYIGVRKADGGGCLIAGAMAPSFLLGAGFLATGKARRKKRPTTL